MLGELWNVTSTANDPVHCLCHFSSKHVGVCFGIGLRLGWSGEGEVEVEVEVEVEGEGEGEG